MKPPVLKEMPYDSTLFAGRTVATVIADFDFETYSPAGYAWDSYNEKWVCPHGANKKGLLTVGAQVYTEHPDAEVLCMAYDLKDGKGPRMWTPLDHPPLDLFAHLATGRLLEAWNVSFERWVWDNICRVKYGWPELPVHQLRCAMAKARAFAIPGSLGKAAEVLKLTEQKDTAGKKLIERYSVPRNPSKTDLRTRLPLAESPEDTQALYDYCIQDIATEAEASSLIPDLNPFELKVWKADQAINHRGVAIDLHTIDRAIILMEYVLEKGSESVKEITQDAVQSANEIANLRKWLSENGVYTETLRKADVSQLLSKDNIPDVVREILELRTQLGSLSIKKLYAMANQVGKDDRIHDLFGYYGAHTGRAKGYGPQPQNLPNSGPDTWQCGLCKGYQGHGDYCRDCMVQPVQKVEWDKAINDPHQAIFLMLKKVQPDTISFKWPNPMALIAGSLRGMFIAKPGYKLVGSDYSAIEAVVLAALAGEDWRLEVFRTHGMIYEMSASKITGLPFEEFEKHKKETGQHHPLRKKVGKVAELASGYQGWIGAWKRFGAEEFFSEEEMKQAILAWRKASPSIVQFWGGQVANWRPYLYGVEGAVIDAIQNPGKTVMCKGIQFLVQRAVLYITLLSGRNLVYHSPSLSKGIQRPGFVISYYGWNTNATKGALGWVKTTTYGGCLVENIVQATARDILMHAIVRLEEKGLPVVLHVHDEIVIEVPEKMPDAISTLEMIMMDLPEWAQGWPLKASGGWEGPRYRK